MPRNPELISRGATVAGASSDAPAIAAAAAEWFARRDAGLSVPQERAFQRWLAADPRHGAALARFDSAWSTFGKPTRTGAADELCLELAGRAERRRRRRLSAAAAALAVLFALGAFWRFPRHEEPASALPATAMMLVPARQVLPDGSVVILKNGAQVAEAFTAALRRVELKQGEAMFEVTKNQSRPFVVSAGGIEVRAVGTAFSVEFGGKTVEVLVTEGTVSVGKGASAYSPSYGAITGSKEQNAGDVKRREETTDERLPAQPSTVDFPNQSSALHPPSSASIVEAGHRIVVEIAPSAPAPKAMPVAAAELDERLAWRNRRVEFSGTPLAEAVALLNREAAGQSEVKLVIDDPTLRSMRVSGIFRTDNTVAFVLLLEAGFGVKAERSGSTISLRKVSASR
ncbi:MAG: FecR domain-containing protein [Opitutaceae bacterium]|nr:FecR domain-containing protein [Opitutaceae bacterium]